MSKPESASSRRISAVAASPSYRGAMRLHEAVGDTEALTRLGRSFSVATDQR